MTLTVTTSELSAAVHGVGPARAEVILKEFDVRRRPAHPPMLMGNCFGTPNWKHDTGVQWLLNRVEAAYKLGIRRFLLNGPWFEGTPGKDGFIPKERWSMLRRLLKPWLKAHPDALLGPYLRERGNDPQWPSLMFEERRGRRPIDAEVNPWLDLGCKIIGIDKSASRDVIVQYARELNRQGVMFIGEPHSDYHRPFATLTIERHQWSTYHSHALLPPDVWRSNAPRYLWLSGHKVSGTGKTVWELLGITRDEMIGQYIARGWGLIHSDANLLAQLPRAA